MPVIGMESFKAGLAQARRQPAEAVTAIQKHAVADLFRMLAVPHDRPGNPASGSPRLTGRFIASLRVSVGSPDRSYEPALTEGALFPLPDAQDAMNRLAGLRPFQTVLVTQSVPYAGSIEGGFSRKTPRGVFANTFIAFAALAQSYRLSAIAKPSDAAPF